MIQTSWPEASPPPEETSCGAFDCGRPTDSSGVDISRSSARRSVLSPRSSRALREHAQKPACARDQTADPCKLKFASLNIRSINACRLEAAGKRMELTRTESNCPIKYVQLGHPFMGISAPVKPPGHAITDKTDICDVSYHDRA